MGLVVPWWLIPILTSAWIVFFLLGMWIGYRNGYAKGWWDAVDPPSFDEGRK